MIERPYLEAVRPEWLRSSCIEGLVDCAQASIHRFAALGPNGYRSTGQKEIRA